MVTTPSNPSAGASTPVVLIAPAMAIGSRFYTPLVSAFTERGWVARALPRRGFEPDQPRASRGENWSYGDEIDTIATAVHAARRDHPDRPVIIVGHSLGAQLAAGHELNHPGADALVTVGGCIPHFRHYPHFGLPVAAGAALIPAITAAFGFVPEPAFGAPGARTLMREWARMVLTGRPPFPAQHKIDTAALIVYLEGDTLAPRRGVDSFARELFAAGSATRWDYTRAEVPAGASNDHIKWVRSPGPVVDRIVAWWSELHAAHESPSAIGHCG
ncbi:alpha/beta hydrolase [Nocardia sp. NPDC050378]|uniref:serine aminopeptidase domain-containing protein n=1 Tax=Nocardia sp. NPDC050378 TaxID=3155400 RepID=UPI0033F46FEE